ncbi:MAG: nucleoside monophosphate kinase [Verrucomicrobia bacterium]|nr:nucleoside monophosphate kinase [Verrucomicrobiota bacterium]
MTRYRTILIFGAPGSGKGTQGKILGKIPGFYHCACGDVFRSLDPASQLGAEFLEYSSKGQLVPDEMTVRLWHESIRKTVDSGKFKPDHDYLILDGIPRNVSQAILMEMHIEVRRVFHLSCPDRDKLVARLKKRALRDNRLDDANEEIIRHRLATYDSESKPMLQHYSMVTRHDIDASLTPLEVVHKILEGLLEETGTLKRE